MGTRRAQAAHARNAAAGTAQARSATPTSAPCRHSKPHSTRRRQPIPIPGRVIVHRLNRTEYTNAVRDLLALDIDGRSLLSADEPDQQGFDNVAGVLSVSPRLLENYLAAASVVSRLAVRRSSIGTVENTFKIPTALVQDDRTSDDLPFGSRGGISIPYQFPLDGEYRIKVLLKRQLYLYLIGMGEPHQIDIRLDGALIKRFTIGGGGKGMTAPESFAGNTQGDPEWEVYMHTADEGLTVSLPVTAGAHEVGVSFVRRHWEAEGILQPPQRGFARTTNELYFGNPAVDIVSIAGPYSAKPADDTPSRRAVFTCRPSAGGARRTMRAHDPLEARAPRVSPAGHRQDLETLLDFYRAGQAEEGFEAGIQRGLRRILASPSFLFRIEREPANAAPGSVYRLNDIDLASRLSFFLWSSIPDDELLDAAARGTLSTPAVLEQQVRRMLADRRSQALDRQLRQPVADDRQAVGCRARCRRVSGIRREPPRGVPAGNATLRERAVARGSQRRRTVDGQLHLRQRAAGAPLSDPQRLRQPLQARDLCRRAARRTARAGQHPDRDLVPQSHLAGRCAADGCSRTSSGRRRPRRRRTCRPFRTPVPMARRARFASRWKRTGRIPRARCATCAWIHWASRSRTSMHWASGGRRSTPCRSMRPRRFPTARSSTESPACVGCSPITRRTSRGRSRRSCWRMRSAEASKPQTSPRSGESRNQSAAGSYRWSSLIMGIVKSTPFTMSTARTADAAPVSTAAP